MHLKILLTAAAATALIAGAAQAQMSPAGPDPAKAPMPPMADTAVNPMSAPADAVQRWSTDRSSRVPALPRLDGGLPRCRQTVHRGAVIHG